jgi:hypothetical protein
MIHRGATDRTSARKANRSFSGFPDFPRTSLIHPRKMLSGRLRIAVNIDTRKDGVVSLLQAPSSLYMKGRHGHEGRRQHNVSVFLLAA